MSCAARDLMPKGSNKKPSNSRRSLSAEHRQAISRALKGKKKPRGFMSETHKAKIRDTTLKKKKPDNFMTEAHKQKIADGMRKAWERRRALKLAQEAEAGGAEDAAGGAED